MTSLDNILGLHDYSMIYALQAEFNRVRGSFDLADLKGSKAAFGIFRSELRETVIAVTEKDYEELRDGVGDIITTILYLAYLCDMDIKEKQVKDIYFNEGLYPCEDYTCYVNEIYKAACDLEKAIDDQDIEAVKHQIIRVTAKTYLGLPEFSRFSIRDDLVEITRASLSKICPTVEEAEISIKNYADEGCLTYWKETPSGGYAIYSTEEQMFRGEVISKNKFLKYYKWKSPVFEKITNEETKWNCYKNYNFEALAMLEPA